MTLTIHRQVSLQRLAIALGLAALLGAVAVGVSQNTDTGPAEVITPNVPVGVAGDSTAYWKRLQPLQDGFLPPVNASEPSNYWVRLQAIQDGYLPPAVASESNVGSKSNVGSNGLSDNRTSGPR